MTTDASGARVPSIGQHVMHYVDYSIGTVCDRHETPGGWEVWVRWSDDPTWPMCHTPDELLDPPATTIDSDSPAL